MRNLLRQEKLEKDVKDIIWTLERMISRGEKCNETYDALVKQLKNKEKEITVIKKANGVY